MNWNGIEIELCDFELKDGTKLKRRIDSRCRIR